MSGYSYSYSYTARPRNFVFKIFYLQRWKEAQKSNDVNYDRPSSERLRNVTDELHWRIILNNQPDAAVCSQFYSTVRLLYMFRAFYTPIIRSTISTLSTASGTNHSIVSTTFFQRGLVPGHAGRK